MLRTHYLTGAQQKCRTVSMPFRPRYLIRAAICVLVVGGTACSQDGGPELGSTSGLEFPQPIAPAVGPGLTLDSMPLARLGGIEGTGPHQFSSANVAATLPGGRIVVGDVNEDEIDEFRVADQRHIRRWARAGDGPGDVRTPVFMQTVDPDTVMVYDLDHGRFTAYRDGEVLTTARLADPVVEIAGTESTEYAWTYVDWSRSSYGFTGLVDPNPFWLRRVRLTDGEAVDSIGPFPGRTSYQVSGGRNNFSFDAPFTPVVAVAARDTLVVIAGDAGRQVSVYVRGEPSLAFDAPIEPRATDAALVAEWLDSWVPEPREDASNRDRELGLARREAFQEALETVAYPDTAPALEDVLIGSDHSIWVREFRLPDGVQRWWRLAESWQQLDLPPRVTLLAATDSTVVIRSYDDFDVPVVEVLRFNSCAQGAC